MDPGPSPTELVCPVQVADITECPVCASDATCDAPTHTDQGDGTVLSSCCGLVWQKDVDGVSRDFKAAYTYCESLSLSGGGWRLPTITELQTLVVGMTAPTIDQTIFPNTPGESFWTGTAYEFEGRAWNVTFFDGSPQGGRLTNLDNVRCVR